MNENDIDLRSFEENKKEEDRRMLESSSFDDYVPIQKNSKLFKFILYTSKVEIKANSLIKMIYSTSLFEIALWFIGFLLFIASPSNMYLIWVLIIHIIKGVLGFVILSAMPKTWEIIENIAKNPQFEEEKMTEMIQSQIRETFMDRWTENRRKLLFYLISTVIALIIDVTIFIVQIVVFGRDEWILMQTCLLFIILVFLSKIHLNLTFYTSF
jgi:hypothetical protein